MNPTKLFQELSCPTHEEADTKIVCHTCNINYPAEIVIRSIDTDIAAIMLGNMHHLKNDLVVWMLTGTGNNLRYVNLTKIHAELGKLICQSLPGYHAISGCDFNPAFFRKGKLKPYKTLKKFPEYQEAFKNFETDGEGDIDDNQATDRSSNDEDENIDDNDV
ncbi:uncharacterized protein TNCV_2944691 [Trichonephila clavipes]|nr:uncharacterized protein TNCV_2944691 [Trichonephila clavipes]